MARKWSILLVLRSEGATLLRRVALLILLVSCICDSAEAKSVYAITDHNRGMLKVYKIEGDQLLKCRIGAEFSSAVDVTVDSNLKLLFITFEENANIVWADAETIEQKGFITIAGSSQLAGVVADETKQMVYALERGSNRLYICDWNDVEEKLELINTVTLTDLGGGLGMTLDKNTRRLYVTNNTATVHYYDANNPNWTHLGTRNVGRAVADIEVDPNNGQHHAFLYTGAFYTGSGGHQYLVKHDLEKDTNPNKEQDIGTVPIGLAVDSDSGLVYVTTSSRELRVYDCSGPNFVRTYSGDTQGSNGPAGICVGDVSLPCKQTCECFVNGSFEDDGYIANITVQEPNGWDVNLPASAFKGRVYNEWVTDANWNLTIYTDYFHSFEVNEMAMVSQELYLTDTNEVIFDVNLATDVLDWDPNKARAVVLVDGEAAWDSNDLSSGEYYDEVYTVEDKYRDGAPHTVSFGMRVKVAERLWQTYYTHWDYIECTEFCGGGGLLAGDFNHDCYVDYKDLKLFAESWLSEVEKYDRYNLFKGDDGAEDGGTVTFRDFAVLGLNWQQNSYEEPNEP